MISSSDVFYDDFLSASRTWPRCNFQAIRDDPVDQYVFQMFGGKFENWQRDLFHPHGCDIWAKPHQKESCTCTAPLKLIGNGTFVEIGANDGLHMSNSYFFERHLRWRGMCVEANPYIFKKLVKNRPKCININSLVGSSGAHSTRLPFLSFYRNPGEEKAQTARDWETGLSGIEGSEHDGNHEILSFEKAKQFAATVPGLHVSRSMISVESFAKLFAEHKLTRVDFLSIDVEGNELAVLRSIDFDRVYVRVIVTEATTRHVIEFLNQRGFRLLHIVFRLGDHVFVNKNTTGF